VLKFFVIAGSKRYFIYGREFCLKDPFHPFDRDTQLRSLIKSKLCVINMVDVVKRVDIVQSFVNVEKFLINWYSK